MNTSMIWMIGVIVVMGAYGIAAAVGYSRATKRGDLEDQIVP